MGDEPRSESSPDERDVLARLRAASDAEQAGDEFEELPDPMAFEPEPGERWNRRQMLLLAGLTLLAAILRLYGIGEWSLWVDEAHTLRDATVPADQFWSSFTARYPVAYLLLRSVIDWFPYVSEAYLRLPYAFFGILTVPLLAIVGASIVGTRTALLAALFLALDPWHLYWSQNARAYAIMLPLTLAACGFLWVAVQRASRKLYVLAIASLIVGGLAHPTAFLLFSLFGLVIFLTLWHKPGAYRTAIVVWASVLAIGVGIVAWPAVHEHVSWVRTAKATPSLVHFVQTTAFFVRAPLALAAVAGFLALRHSDEKPASWYLGIWAFVPLSILGLLSCGLFQVTAQYGFYCLPAFCLLAAALCSIVATRIGGTSWQSRILHWALPAMLVIDMAAYDALYFTAQHGDRPRWGEAAAQVMADSADGECLVLTTNQPSMDYYLHPQVFFQEPNHDGRIEVRSIEPWTIEEEGGGAAYLRDLQYRSTKLDRHLFFVLTEPEFAEKDVDGSCADWLRANAHLVHRYPSWVGPKDMTVYVYRIPAHRR